MQKNKPTRSISTLYVWAAFACAVSLFIVHFFFGGGCENIISDSYAYISLANGRAAGIPFSTRILQPILAAFVASQLAISIISAFQLLTAIELFACLLVIRAILRKRMAGPGFQAAVILAFGSALAVTFSFTSVMVDPLLLLLVCLAIAAIDREYFIAALLIACLAAMTKEYGVILGFVLAGQLYLKGYRRAAIAAALLPIIVLLVVILTQRSASVSGFPGWQSFIQAMFGYHVALYRFRGGLDYFKILYMWSWAVLWPVLIIAVLAAVGWLKKRRLQEKDMLNFAIVLLAAPVLLLADWGRALIIITPFACAVLASHPLSKNNRFVLLLAIGGLATALARPFHGGINLPHIFTLTMIVISVVVSALMAVQLWNFVLRFRHAQAGPHVETPLPSECIH